MHQAIQGRRTFDSRLMPYLEVSPATLREMFAEVL